jgi:hypothetical protein
VKGDTFPSPMSLRTIGESLLLLLIHNTGSQLEYRTDALEVLEKEAAFDVKQVLQKEAAFHSLLAEEEVYAIKAEKAAADKAAADKTM